MRPGPPIQLAGAWECDGTTRDRLLRAAPPLIDTPRCTVVGAADVGRAPNGAWCVVVGQIDDDRLIRGLAPDAGSRTGAELVAWVCQSAGPAALDAVRGPTTIVLWDGGEELKIVRDALGGRGAHYAAHPGGGTVFGEEVRDVLLGLPATPPPDRDAVSVWIERGVVADQGTLFSGIRRVPAGGELALEGQARRAVRRHWVPKAPVESSLITDLDQAADAVRAAIDQAVLRAGSGNVGVMLSGGLDSTTVAASAAHEFGPGRVHGYSAVFPEHPAADEDGLIGTVGSHLGVSLTRCTIRGGRAIAGAVAHVEAWSIPPTSSMNFLWGSISERAVSSGIDVMLTGEGGDELFARSPHYYLADLLRRGRLRRAWELAAEFPGASPGPRARARVLAAVARGARPSRPHRSEASADASLLAPRDHAHAMAYDVDSLWLQREGPYWWRYHATAVTTMRELYDAVGALRRRAAVHGLTLRHPLLTDRDLVELMLRIDPGLHFDAARDRPVARQAAQGRLPPAVLERQGKSHFTDLLQGSLAGSERATIDALLADAGARSRAYVDGRALDERVLRSDASDRHPAGAYGWMWDAWRVTILECWLRELEHAGSVGDLIGDGPVLIDDFGGG